jgi:RNA polymerase sigma-70 factor (ECF subfamily)
MGENAGLTADVALVERASSGDSGAFEALVGKYQDRVYNIALRMMRRAEDAEDVTQETFLKVYKALPSFGGRSAVYTWIFRIAVNASLSKLRSLGRRHDHEVAVQFGSRGDDAEAGATIEPASTEAGPLESVEVADSAARVQRAIDALSPDDRAVVVLRESEGLSYDEIADAVGSTRMAVKSRLHRARTELATKLKDLLK